MPYIRELDDLPWEVRLNTATTLAYWPKIDGANAVATSASFTVYSPLGVEIQSSTSITPVTVSSVSRLDVAVSAITSPTPSTVLLEHYQVRLSFVSGGITYTDVRLFDVVRHPFGQPSTSFNDFLEVRGDAGDVLDRFGQRLGQTAGATAREYAAAVCAVNARLVLDARIRDQVTHDGQARPALILDRQRLARVERYEALAHLYRNLAPAPEDGEDSVSRLYRHFRDQANTAWGQVGPLAYDVTDDGIEDSELKNLNRVSFLTRVQG